MHAVFLISRMGENVDRVDVGSEYVDIFYILSSKFIILIIL